MRHIYCLLLVVALSAVAVPFAAQAEDVPEHPVIRPFPGSVLAQNMSKHLNFEKHDFYVKNPETGRRETKTVKGKYWYLLYEVKHADGSRNTDISQTEFHENFKAAALEKGGEVRYEDVGALVFTIPRDNGGTTWCKVSTTSLGQTYLIIVDEEPLKTVLTFGAAEMKAALDKDGRIALYGILFDLDKATLKQESDRQLQHVVTLLNQSPDLRLEIQGHTDDQGSDNHNLDLSDRRAATVLNYLVLFGIDESRLTATGY